MASKHRPYHLLDSTDPEQSLMDLSLKSITRALENRSLECFPELPSLPIRVKYFLLKYFAAYRIRGVTADELKSLGTGGQDESYLGSSQIQDTDLSGSFRTSLTVDDLDRSFPWTASFDFASLTYLCLARPGPDISWPSFLHFALNKPSLTHLSLAYWPKPTTGTA